jgi:flagellin-like hook-associated protein FlgL
MTAQLTGSVRTSLYALQRIAADIAAAQTRLATGKRVNTALDNPAAFFTASSLSARASTLNLLVDEIATAKATVEAAGTAITSIQGLIDSARDLAYDALASASTLAKVTGSVTGLTGAHDMDTQFENGDTITVGDGTTTATYTKANNDTLSDFIDAVNNTANLNVTASLTADGRVELEATGVNSVIVGGSSSVAELASIGLVAGTTTSTTNSLRLALAQEFDTIRDQIDDVANDASFSGTNLLSGSSLTVRLGENSESILTVTGSAVTASDLGLSEATTTGGDFQYDGDIETFLAALDAAETTLEVEAARYGSSSALLEVREEFATSMINLLNTGADDLLLADANAESAALLSLQTRQELTQTTLALVAQSEASVLRLFA